MKFREAIAYFLGPWDVVKKVFNAEEHKNMSIHDKSDLFSMIIVNISCSQKEKFVAE